MFSRQSAKRLQELATGWDDAHIADDRLKDNAGDPGAVFLKCRFKAGDVVVLEHKRVACCACCNARRIWNGERCGRASSGNEQGVDMAVVIARELYDDIAPRESAGESDRTQGSFRPRFNRTRFLCGRFSLYNPPRHPASGSGWPPKPRAPFGCASDRRNNCRKSMAKD